MLSLNDKPVVEPHRSSKNHHGECLGNITATIVVRLLFLLQLLLGDGNHVPQDPPVASEQITITVE